MENFSSPPRYNSHDNTTTGKPKGVPDRYGDLSTDVPQPDEDQQVQEVEVDAAVEEFRNVERELRRTLSRGRIQAGASDEELKDVEANQQGDHFDLKDFLQGAITNTSQHGIGFRKKMGVVFKGLTVVGEGADASHISNVADAFFTVVKAFNPIRWFKKEERGTDFDILHDLTGFVKDGEMLLVLGRPGSGCSTFLRVVANERKTYKDIHGIVTYGGVPATEFDRFAGEAIYTAEEDVHFPTLTVKQTLHFSLKTKTPGTRVPEQTRRNFRQEVVYMLTNMFGLTKQINTLVGNEWVRGLSGGERKRMTITEAMSARAAINAWDCSVG